MRGGEGVKGGVAVYCETVPLALRSLSADGRLLLSTKALRAFSMSMLSVVLALYLAALGHSSAAIGVLLTLALVGEVLWTAGLTSIADRLGRRRMLVIGGVLMAASGLALAAAPPLWLLVAIALLGAMSPTGKDTGPTLAIEQAALPETTPADNRTAVFAWYNLVSAFAGAVGALVAGATALLNALGVAPVDAFRLLALAYGIAALLLSAMFLRLSPAVEPSAPLSLRQPLRMSQQSVARSPQRGQRRPFDGLAQSRTQASVGVRGPVMVSKRTGWMGLHRSRRTVAGLSALFGVDAFAGGLISQSLVAYWFHLQYALDTAALGSIFFAANLLSGFSFLAAAPLAARIGLINTMVLTHLPSNVMLVLVPFMPTPELAVGLFVARHALSQMDVPTRQSYTMAVVDPDERSAAAGLTTVARSIATTGSPALFGQAIQAAAYGLPLVLAGCLKIAYDLTLWVSFRRVRPPEESGVDL